MPALRRFRLGLARIEEIKCPLVTAPLQVMSQHRRRIRAELLFELEDSVQRFANLLGLTLRSCLHELQQGST